MGKTTCVACNKKCKGHAIKLSETGYIHPKCFTCKECKKELPTNAFFLHKNDRYCTADYQRLFGTKCQSCEKYVEGEVVSVLNRTYHRDCIVCSKCKKNIGAGNRVTVVKDEFWCQNCVQESENQSKQNEAQLSRDDSIAEQPPKTSIGEEHVTSPDSGFGGDVRDGIDVRSPISATSDFKSDESGDVELFEKSLQNTTETPVNLTRDLTPDLNRHGNESSAANNVLSNGHPRFGKFYTVSFLDKNTGFKRGPSINPRENAKQHFHRPDDFSYRKVRSDIIKPNKTGMLNSLGSKQQTTTSLRRTGDPPYKPIKSQEPIQLAKLPDAQRFDHDHKKPIERDDFVAPPETAAVYPELLWDLGTLRRSTQSGDAVDGDNNIENDNIDDEIPTSDPKVEREIDELSKISGSGAARIILEELKKKKSVPQTLDPRSSSRTPSAAVEPAKKTRYESPVFASPSRDVLRTRFWQFDEPNDTKYRSSTSPSGPRPGYGLRSRTLDNRSGVMSAMSFYGNHVNSLDPGPGHRSAMASRAVTLGPKSGYASDTTDGYYPSNFPYYYRRPESSNAVLERMNTPVSDAEGYDPTTGLKVTRNIFQRINMLVDGRLTPVGARSSLRRKIVTPLFVDQENAKVYEYEKLRLDNRDRPPGLDNGALEKYLVDDDFERVFEMKRDEFMELAEWKRNDLKQRVGLFESASEKYPVAC